MLLATSAFVLWLGMWLMPALSQPPGLLVCIWTLAKSSHVEAQGPLGAVAHPGHLKLVLW